MKNTAMATAAELGSNTELAHQSDERIVIHGVLDRLGRPKNLFRTVARRVGEKKYRVNVYCTDESNRPVNAVTITDSFFVTLDGQEIVSVPTITRKYK